MSPYSADLFPVAHGSISALVYCSDLGFDNQQLEECIMKTVSGAAAPNQINPGLPVLEKYPYPYHTCPTSMGEIIVNASYDRECSAGDRQGNGEA